MYIKMINGMAAKLRNTIIIAEINNNKYLKILGAKW